ncbi:MAG: Ppx/GppA family phosphatase [Alphaproteobacteria bacterium]|jgi:exopolyphosphatase/guanosine-5'-triphosphate,3'-diphosphate pyrophosphatase|nr:Ppx/GppA family phosphatase [Alphaproteobacteria bacterium]
MIMPLERARDARRLAVIDVGSNSIRLVVFDELGRAPLSVFNERVMCGLGRELARTGRLHAGGVKLALDNLARFTRLLQGMHVDRVDVLATAAVREAEDGPSFVDQVKRRCNLDVTVIDGTEEARLSALGVLSGAPGADGVVGDQGGGSLELVGLDQGRLRDQVSLPLGPFRLMEIDGGRDAMRAHIARTLDGQRWLQAWQGRTLFPVGGAWRTLARIDMDNRGHPLHIIQNYTVRPDDLANVAGLIARQGKSSLARMAAVSKRRTETLPYAAMVLEALIARLQPRDVVFSAFGLREGHLYDLLSEDDKALDPLLAACADIARRLGRFGHAELIAAWTGPLFDEGDARFDRLRTAACLLSDIAWSEHPDYRAEHARLKALRLPIVGIDHPGRALLAAALAVRYGGALGDSQTEPSLALLDETERIRAHRLGLALRLAHTLSGGAAELLERTALVRDGAELLLTLPPDEAALSGHVVQRRLNALASAFGAVGRITVDPRGLV